MPIGKNSISRVAGAGQGKKSAAKPTASEKKANEPVVIPVEEPLSTEITIAAAPKKKSTRTGAPKTTKSAPAKSAAPAEKKESSPAKVTTFCAPGEELPVHLL